MTNAMYPSSTVTLASGEEHHVTPANTDMCRLELAGAKEGISLKETPITAMTFIAWAFLKRTGVYPGPWIDFRDKDCVNLDTDDEGEDTDDEGGDDPKS